ncbi:MAG TPA: SDR family NAD(P)-dependent oxidoreductase [Puia sp.]|nr:SDR family NAD(P)-dependent oxidoreductase [Puia sp.]
MARIFITGSADGLGQLAAKTLVSQGHQVVLHARNPERGRQAMAKTPGAEEVLTADLSSLRETVQLAKNVNELGAFDAVIHNAGVYQVSNPEQNIDGLPILLAVNTIAPYILTCLIQKPKRLIYLSSGMHTQGDPSLKGLHGNTLRVTYSDSKLHDLMLSMAVARKWKNVLSNAVDPGWVPTKMGGAGAPDNLQKGVETQVWLATSNDATAKVTGSYFHHKKETRFLPEAANAAVQEKFLAICQQLSGVHFPGE